MAINLGPGDPSFTINITGPLILYFPSSEEIYECIFPKTVLDTLTNIQVCELIHFKSAILTPNGIVYNVYCINRNEHVLIQLTTVYDKTIKSDDINTLIDSSKLALQNFKLFFKLFV